MKGRGRPKKCAKKLNFNKPTVNSKMDDLPIDSSICNKQGTLSSVCENEAIKSDVIAIPILQDNSMDHVSLMGSSDMNNDFVPVTNDIVERKFPVQLENETDSAISLPRTDINITRNKCGRLWVGHSN